MTLRSRSGDPVCSYLSFIGECYVISALLAVVSLAQASLREVCVNQTSPLEGIGGWRP